MKKKPKTNQQLKSAMRKKCVTLAKLIVRKQAGFRCVKCGRGEPDKQTQGSHIYPEGRYTSMSADIDNILCLCAGCHMWSNDSWHENPLESVEWFHKIYPTLYQTLKGRSRLAVQMTLADWTKKHDELKTLDKTLTNC